MRLLNSENYKFQNCQVRFLSELSTVGTKEWYGSCFGLMEVRRTYGEAQVANIVIDQYVCHSGL